VTSLVEPPGGSGMDRRGFLLSSLAGALIGPVAVEAQPAKAYRVGVLSTGNPRPAAIYQAFELKLREAGYVDGQNLAIEFRNAEGKTDRLPGLAAELVRLNPDVVVGHRPGDSRAQERRPHNPIVIVSVNYPAEREARRRPFRS